MSGPAEVVGKISRAIKIASDWYKVPADRLASHLWAESTWAEEGTNPRIRGADGHGQGVAQIDDRFHQFSVDPLDLDVLLQICYEALFLACLYAHWQDWDKASMAYNGDPSSQVVQGYGEKIKLFMQTKPWEALMEKLEVT